MNRPFRTLVGLAAGAALLSGAAVAVAQDHPQPPPSATGENWHEHMLKHMQQHIKALHDMLQIRPDQEAAFQTFIASMKPPEGAEHGDMAHEHQDMAQLTTPQRLDRMAAHMAEHQKAFERHAAAVKTFYAALSPEQQRAFDAMAAMHHHGMGGHGMGGHDMGDMGEHGPMGPPHGMGGPGEM